MSSWSDRERDSKPSDEEIKKRVRDVNGVLNHLANDENLHEDMRDPAVMVALKHWTGEKRLPPDSEELNHFQDNYRIMATLGKIQHMQAVCRALGIGIPLDHIVHRKTELDASIFTNKCGLVSKPQEILFTKSIDNVNDNSSVKTENETIGIKVLKAEDGNVEKYNFSLLFFCAACLFAISYRFYLKYSNV